MKKKIINKRVNGDSEELHALKGFKVLAVGNGTIGEECALSIMLMNENNVAGQAEEMEKGSMLLRVMLLTGCLDLYTPAEPVWSELLIRYWK